MILCLAMDTDLSAADAFFWGEDADDRSGISVSGAGDVNGDGYDDFIIGAFCNDDDGDSTDQTYLLINSVDITGSAGGNINDQGNGISTDTTENIYVTGSFQDSTSFNSFNLTSSGESDIFVAKLSDTCISVRNNVIINTELIVNYSNPFNPETRIVFNLPEESEVELIIYNIKGQLIESHRFESGKHNYLWDASDQASGIYLYKLQTETITETRKMLLLK